MGFMAGLATGFFKQQNQDVTDQKSEQDKLTQLSLSNILKNTDSYNASKADYQSRLTEATALAGQTGLQVGDVMNMKNMGLPNTQIILQGLNKPAQATASPAGTISQQTQEAIPGAGGSPTAPAPVTSNPTASMPASASGGGGSASMGQASIANVPASVSPQTTTGPTTPTPQNPSATPVSNTSTPAATPTTQPAISGVRTTLLDHIFGTDPSAAIGSAATSQAQTVTGMSPDELAQARTGRYTPAALPTSGYKIDPSSLIDFSKIKASDYSAKNLPLAIQAAKQNDWSTVASLADNADAIEQRKIAEEAAKHKADSADDFAKENHDINMYANLPGPDGKPIGLQAAQQAYLASKKMAMPGADGSDINPNNLDPQSLYQSMPPAQQAWFDGYTSGRVPWIAGSGKQGQDKSQEILKKIQQVDPTFSPAVSKARTAAYQDLTSTKGNTTGGKLVSGATVINHMVNLLENLNTLGNTSSLTPVNDASNAWASLHGSVALKNAEQAQGNVVDEMSKFLAEKSAGATDADKARVLKNLPLNMGGTDPNTGLPRNQAIVSNMIKLMVGKLEPMASKINDNFGTQINAYDLLPPDSIAKIKSMGYKLPDGDEPTGQTTTPNGIRIPLPGRSIAPQNWSTQNQGQSSQPQANQPAQPQQAPATPQVVIQNGWRYDATTHQPLGPVSNGQ